MCAVADRVRPRSRLQPGALRRRPHPGRGLAQKHWLNTHPRTPTSRTTPTHHTIRRKTDCGYSAYAAGTGVRTITYAYGSKGTYAIDTHDTLGHRRSQCRPASRADRARHFVHR